MACFMVAFLVICSHVTFRIRYDALGITEPMLTWSLNGSRGEYSGEYVGLTDQPITWSTRADGGVASPRNAHIQVNLVMIIGLSTWLGLHFIALVCYVLWPWIRSMQDAQDPFWHNPETAVWIGPLASDPSDPSQREKMEKEIKKHFSQHAKDEHGWSWLLRRQREPVASVVLWSAKKAKRQLSVEVEVPEDLEFDGETPDGTRIPVKGQYDRHDPCLPLMVTIPPGKKLGDTFLVPKDGQEQYRHDNSFAVVVFASKQLANVAIRRGLNANVKRYYPKESAEDHAIRGWLSEGREGQCLNHVFESGAVVEPLNPAWHALTRPPGTSPGEKLAKSLRNLTKGLSSHKMAVSEVVHEHSAIGWQESSTALPSDPPPTRQASKLSSAVSGQV